MNRLTQTDTRCHECKKLFCCRKCRDLHEINKHPRAKTDSDCALCYSNILPLKLFNDDKFLCHLVIRHMPLICVLCGQIYRTSLDLENFKKCQSWRRPEENSISSRKYPPQATPSPIVRTVSCPATCKRDSPLSDSEFHSLQSFASPPELMRNTSTPMHVGVSGYRSNPQFNNKTPKQPTFFIKTPKTPKISSNKAAPSLAKSIDEETPPPSLSPSPSPSPSPSLAFYSATSQLLLNSRESNSDNLSARHSLSGDTPSRSILRNSREDCARYSAGYFAKNSGQILMEVMEEQEEQLAVSMDMTDIQDNLGGVVPEHTIPPVSSSTTINRESVKRVRFSDQHQAAADSTADAFSVNEEFYEAEESPGEDTTDVGNESDARMIKENEDNSDKENIEVGNLENSNDVFKTPLAPSSSSLSSSSASASTSTSSRVVMMVVVENGVELSTSDLMPLINSSLQKLDQRKPFTENIASSISGVSAAAQLQTTVSNCGVVSRSVSSVDSYNALSTVDYFLTPGNPDFTPPIDNRQNTISSIGNGTVSGIISSMAQAMRSAFRALPGGSNLAKSSPPRGMQESINGSGSSGSSQTSLNGSGSFSSIATSLSRRPGKRSRDPMNDSIAGVHRREPRRNGNDNGASPIAKRPRSWHRIRGRDPIARMRRDTTSATRGVSSETQHFQQGSLSVGDTIIPLPSRAHQSTQTD